MAKNSDFMKAFGNGTTNARTVEPTQTERSTDRLASLGYNPNEQSFFDFDRVSTGTSPFPNQNPFSTPGGGLPGWSTDTNFRPLSPPDSASPFSRDWNSGFQNVSNSSVPNIFTNNLATNTRAQYGQVTPPDDEQDGESVTDQQFDEQQEEFDDTAPTKKRRRGGNNAKASNQAPSKRSRKNNRRSVASPSNVDPSRPEDVRRSKFLERNRVAASKCRQKKKEWTQNLEDRSRQLQKDNNNMLMMIDSLRQEVLFLKGEMLRHSECDNTHIQEYLKTCPSEMSGSSMNMPTKRESSSPFDDLSRGQSTVDLDGQSTIDEEITQQGQTNAEIARDENALEALLASSINGDAREGSPTANVAG